MSKLIRIAALAAGLLLLAVAAFLLIKNFIVLPSQYEAAKKLLTDGRYEEAGVAFIHLGDYKDTKAHRQEAYTKAGEILENNKQYRKAAVAYMRSGKEGKLKHAYDLIYTNLGDYRIDAAPYYTVGLKSDGTIVEVGNSPYGEMDVSAWKMLSQYRQPNAISWGYKRMVRL